MTTRKLTTNFTNTEPKSGWYFKITIVDGEPKLEKMGEDIPPYINSWVKLEKVDERVIKKIWVCEGPAGANVTFDSIPNNGKKAIERDLRARINKVVGVGYMNVEDKNVPIYIPEPLPLIEEKKTVYEAIFWS